MGSTTSSSVNNAIAPAIQQALDAVKTSTQSNQTVQNQPTTNQPTPNQQIPQNIAPAQGSGSPAANQQIINQAASFLGGHQASGKLSNSVQAYPMHGAGFFGSGMPQRGFFAEGGSIQDPKSIKKALLVANGIPDRRTMHFSEVGKRIPELEAGANKVATGEMSGEEYQHLVNQHKPVYPYESVPSPASYEDIHRALEATDPRKVSKIGKLADYPEGHPVALRLDIPAYERQGVWVPTIHEGNKTIAHEGAAHISDATFNANENKGIKIAAGGQKNPYAVINGKLKKTSTEDIHKLAQQYLNHPDWRQVGMDPTRHGYFYDRHTQEPVEHAEEVLQVGPLVLAKNPTYGDKSKYKYASGGEVHTPSQMGINVASDNDAGLRYADLIVDGHKTYESRETDSLRPYVGKRVSIVRTGEGKAKAIGAAHIGEPIVVDAKKFRELESKHKVKEGSKFDIKPDQNKYLYPISSPVRYPEEYDVEHGIVARKVKTGIAKADGGDVENDHASNLAKFLEGSKEQKPMYHITRRNFKKFRPSFREAYFLTKDLNFAHEFSKGDYSNFRPGTNIMPLHVSAKNPFDYENIEHVNKLVDTLNKLHPSYVQENGGKEKIKKILNAGSWADIEEPEIQNAIRSNGHDGFYMDEQKVKNLGVYSPSQLKSAIGNRGTYDPSNPDITKAEGGDVEPQDTTTPTRQLNDAGLYSYAAEAAEALPQEKGSPQQMIASLRNKNVKPDELYWSGVHNAFRDRKTITKQELADHFRNALPQLSSSVLTPSQGSSHDPASKYSRYTAEGKLRSDKQKNLSTNYREVLNTIPNLDDLQWVSDNRGDIGKNFESSHWNEPNIISHVRLSDRETQPPQGKKPKTPSPDAVTQITGSFGKQDSIAYSTKHKNIFVTPSMKQRNKYAITHGPSGRMINSTPLDFYHAMHNANQLAEKYPHVFDLDEQGITNWIADPKNSEERKGIVNIVSSEPPALPAPKRAKPFNKEKILHVDESQSDFGQHIKKLNDRLVESKQRLEESTNRHNETQAEFERLSKENPHLFDENGDLISSYALNGRYSHGLNLSTEQKEKYDQDYKNWRAIFNAKDSARNSKFTMEELQRKIPATERDITRIPKAPYVDNTSKWTDLNVKRILTEAAKGNYDKVIWTPGSVQSKIYGIGQSYSKIYYNPKTKVFTATPTRGSRITRGVTQYNIEPEKLPDYIGNELTKRLLATSQANVDGETVHMLQGKGLDVPNHGQEVYYGKIFPKRLLELAREHDPEAQLSEHRDNDKVVDKFPALKITPKMRESILKNGFKAYKSGGYTGDSSILSAAQDPSKAIRKALMVAKSYKR